MSDPSNANEESFFERLQEDLKRAWGSFPDEEKWRMLMRAVHDKAEAQVRVKYLAKSLRNILAATEANSHGLLTSALNDAIYELAFVDENKKSP